MNRRTLDIGIPVLYAIAVVVTTALGNERVIGTTVVLGAMVVGLYFAALRPKPKSKV